MGLWIRRISIACMVVFPSIAHAELDLSLPDEWVRAHVSAYPVETHPLHGALAITARPTPVAECAVAVAGLAVDWLQTQWIATSGTHEERNIFLGRSPSVGRVNIYFGLSAVSLLAASLSLDSGSLERVCREVAELQVGAIARNASHGIGFGRFSRPDHDQSPPRNGGDDPHGIPRWPGNG